MSARRVFAISGPVLAVLSSLLAMGCDDGTAPKPAAAPRKEARRAQVGDHVYLEVLPDSRRVVIEAEVCLREGALEQLLTRKNKKEHEAILAAWIDARKVHEALLLAGAKEGSPVRWQPQYRAPEGTPVRISLVYEDNGKKKTVPARSWIRHRKTKKELASDWVFAGSVLLENPLEKNGVKHYLANDGDVICIANFEGAALDLPMLSSKDNDDHGYEAWTERIPPVGTAVTVILEPVLPTKK